MSESKDDATQGAASTYAEIAARASKLLTEHAERQLKRGIALPHDELGVAKAFMDMMAKLLSNPYQLAVAQMNLVWDYFSLWQRSVLRFLGQEAPPLAQPDAGDRRFRDKAWEQDFIFDYIKQSYLLLARHVHDVVCCVEGLDDHTQRKISFFTRQFIDALSPTNFLLTNPEVLRETVRSHGQNLLNGLANLLRDIEDGEGQLRIRMTDTSAFKLGRDVATTAGKVVFENELMQLLQYAPRSPRQFKRPLLIVPPWINKYYILDLRPDNSFIRWALDQGHTVFCISWVNPDEKLADKGFDDYLKEGALAALDAVCKQCDVKEVNAVGYCLGGTLLAIAAAYLTKRRDKRLASLTFFTSLLDFKEPGELGVFIDDTSLTALEEKMSERGYLEGSEMAATFNMLRANDLIWSFVVNNYLLGKDPFPFDLLFWNSDSTRMPAKMHAFYLRNMYRDNRLSQPGGIDLLGVPIDLGKIKTPAYFIATIEDHIAPWKACYQGARLLSGPVRFVLGGSGHIAGIVNPPAANKYGYWVNPATKLPETAEAWFEGAQQNPGSWWTDWQAWVTGHDATQVEPRDPAKGKLKALEDAPGSFVKARVDAKAAA